MFFGMTQQHTVTRRSFLAAAAAAPLAFSAGKKVPIGIELYSVRHEMDKDTLATVRAIAKMGYEVVEFYGPYYNWTPEFAKEVRKVMDDGGTRCNSTHNGGASFTEAGIGEPDDSHVGTRMGRLDGPISGLLTDIYCDALPTALARGQITEADSDRWIAAMVDAVATAGHHIALWPSLVGVHKRKSA